MNASSYSTVAVASRFFSTGIFVEVLFITNVRFIQRPLYFTEAREHAANLQQKVVLIDGETIISMKILINNVVDTP